MRGDDIYQSISDGRQLNISAIRDALAQLPSDPRILHDYLHDEVELSHDDADRLLAQLGHPTLASTFRKPSVLSGPKLTLSSPKE
ncbi:MAG: hypothetical protein AAGE94_11605, partial [Acidobacteriota bacterium]